MEWGRGKGEGERHVQDGLNKGLQRAVLRLEIVDVLLVDALAPVVAVEVIDAFRVVDGRAGRAGGRVAIALYFFRPINNPPLLHTNA